MVGEMGCSQRAGALPAVVFFPAFLSCVVNIVRGLAAVRPAVSYVFGLTYHGIWAVYTHRAASASTALSYPPKGVAFLAVFFCGLVRGLLL